MKRNENELNLRNAFPEMWEKLQAIHLISVGSCEAGGSHFIK